MSILLLIIVILSIIVIGPKDFPVVLRKIGNWIGTIKRYFSDVQGNINQITNIEDLDKEDSHTNKKINKDDK